MVHERHRHVIAAVEDLKRALLQNRTSQRHDIRQLRKINHQEPIFYFVAATTDICTTTPPPTPAAEEEEEDTVEATGTGSAGR